MKHKPIIGLTPLYDPEKNHPWMQEDYLDAVTAAGGIPIILPIRGPDNSIALLDIIDGLLLTGGPDIMPQLFGERLIPECGPCCPPRDELELPLIREALLKKIPMMGICRGIQTINVALGGTLYQDIPAQYQTGTPVLHRQQSHIDKSHPSHDIVICENSLLYRAVGRKNLMVNSMHHQTVKDIAPGLRAAAWSDDGLVECLESVNEPFVLGVQWHPECMHRRDESSMELFRFFVGEAGMRL